MANALTLMVLGSNDERLATPFLAPVPDLWDNVYHELIVKQVLSRNQPGSVRQRMLNNEKTIFIFFSSLFWSSDMRTFGTHNRLEWGLPPHPTFVLVSDNYASVDLSPTVRLLWLFQLLWS